MKAMVQMHPNAMGIPNYTARIDRPVLTPNVSIPLESVDIDIHNKKYLKEEQLLQYSHQHRKGRLLAGFVSSTRCPSLLPPLSGL